MGLLDFFRPGAVRAQLDVAPPPKDVGERDGAPPDVLAGTVQSEPRFARGLSLVESLMRDPSEAIREEGPDVYRQMEQDPEISADLFQIKRRVLGRSLEWTPSDTADPFAVEVAEYVARVVRSELDLRGDVRHLFRAITRKYAVGQLVWKKDTGVYGPAGTWIPDRIIAEPNTRYAFRRDGTLCLTGPGGLTAYGGALGTPLTPPSGPYDRKFIVHVNDPEPGDPSGTSILEGVYWSWKFLRAGLGFWLDLLDRFGVPSLIALFESVTDDVNKAQNLADQLAGELAKVANGSAGAINAKSVETVSTGGRGDDFERFCTFLEKRIRKGILSTTLTVDISQVGARAQGEVSQEEVDGVAMWYGTDLASTIERTLGRWVALMRFGDRARSCSPRASFDWRTTATFDEYLRAAESGHEVSRDALYTVYNVPKPANEEDAFTATRTTGTPSKQDPPEVGFADAPFGKRRGPRLTTRPGATTPTS